MFEKSFSIFSAPSSNTEENGSKKRVSKLREGKFYFSSSPTLLDKSRELATAHCAGLASILRTCI